MKISEWQPEPHKRYVVLRDGLLFTAKPCYGLHSPWWVVGTMDGEADPNTMRPNDEWWPLEEFIKERI